MSSDSNPMGNSPNQPLDKIVQDIVRNTSVLTEFYTSNHLSGPSFERDQVAATKGDPDPQDVQLAKNEIMDSTLLLFDLCSGPTKILSHLTVAYQTVACLRWLCHFNVLKNVPPTGTISFAALAARSAVPVASLKTIARMAMTAHILHEPHREQVQHTAASTLLAQSAALHDWALIMGIEPVDIAMKMVEATEKWPHPAADAINQTAFNVALDTDLPFFQHLQKHPALLAKYTEYQRAVSGTEGLDLKHVVEGYDWAKLGAAHVIDVGGAEGLAAIALAKRYPHLTFTVQELPDVVAIGERYLAGLGDAALAARVAYVAHDFFAPQPPPRAGEEVVFLVRMVLHYWAPADCVRILQQLVDAAVGTGGSAARIVVMDTVLPMPGRISAVVERQLRVRDLAMLQLHGSHERTEEDWEAIFAGTRPPLRRVATQLPFGSEMAIMELVV